MELFHTIAGILFHTEMDTAIGPLQSGAFDFFKTLPGCVDIRLNIKGIEEDRLTAPPLSPRQEKELKDLLDLDERVTRTTLVIPPIADPDWMRRIKEQLDTESPLAGYPLLRSPEVRSRVLAHLSRSDSVRIIAHLLTFEIYDYKAAAADIFYLSSQRSILTDNIAFNGIRRLFATFLTAFSAVVVHSSGIVLDGKAALFLAPDEGGKSTILSLFKRGDILCDDYNIIKKEGDNLAVHNTPWGSLMSKKSISAPLGGLFLLEKAPRFELVSIRPEEMLSFAWIENLRFLEALPRSYRLTAFSILDEACRTVPVFRLRFPKDAVAEEAVRRVLS